MTLPLLAAFALCALTDWVAVGSGRRGLEYVVKPATLVLLIALAATGSAPSPWLLVALACGLAGDVLLMLPRNLFVGGLAAFLVGHLAYWQVFAAPLGSRLLWLGALLVVLSPLARRLLAAVRHRPALRAAVVAYLVALVGMAASAIASGSAIAAAGGLLFVVSDGLLGWNRFVEPLAGARVAIHATYHVAQLLLVLALRGT